MQLPSSEFGVHPEEKVTSKLINLRDKLAVSCSVQTTFRNSIQSYLQNACLENFANIAKHLKILHKHNVL